MTLLNDIRMAARIAARDMRGGMQSLWLLVAGVFIGAAAVALSGAASQSLIDGARMGALESVGGDLSLRLYHRAPKKGELEAIRREGAISITTELRPMVRPLKSGHTNEAPVLTELKGVDRSYPLYGTVEIEPRRNLHQTLDLDAGVYGAVADRALFDALDVNLGDRIQIGEAQYQLRGEIIAEPDRAFRAFTLGPRIIVSNESLPASGTIDEGTEVYFYARVKMLPKMSTLSDATAALKRIDQAFPQSGWRMVNAHNGVPGVERSLGLAHVLLLFIGLGVMLIGGGGISGAVRAHIAEKMVIIAILKSVGVRPRVVTAAIAIEIMAAASLGAILGVGLGAFGPVAVGSALAEQLPFTLAMTPEAKPLIAAALFGVLTAVLFAWWPLMGVQDMKSQVLLRNRVSQKPVSPSKWGWIGVGLVLALLILLVFWVSPLPTLTVGFLFGALLLSVFYFSLGTGLSRLAKVLAKGKGSFLRLPLSNLYRAGAPTGPVVLALGLTLTLLVALDAIGVSANNHLQKTLPRSAPDLAAFSLKPERMSQFRKELTASGILDNQRIMPFLHARIEAIKGVAVRDIKIPGSLNWVVRGDRGVSFASEVPEGEPWSDSQIKRPGVSMDGEIAKKLGVGLGDTITLNVGGKVRTGEILKFRTVDWTRLELDFPIIGTPVMFENIPYTYAASLKAKPNQKAALEAFIKNRFPEVPLIRVEDVLHSLAKVISAIVAGLEAAALTCGLVALVVLAGSVLQGLRQRTHEAVLFKVLGARRRQLLSQLMVEFLALGCVVAMTALPLGFGVAYGVTRAVDIGGFNIPWVSGVTLAVATICATLLVGFVVTLRAYATKPARILREREY